MSNGEPRDALSISPILAQGLPLLKKFRRERRGISLNFMTAELGVLSRPPPVQISGKPDGASRSRRRPAWR